jgi:hypothetical protein
MHGSFAARRIDRPAAVLLVLGMALLTAWAVQAMSTAAGQPPPMPRLAVSVAGVVALPTEPGHSVPPAGGLPDPRVPRDGGDVHGAAAVLNPPACRTADGTILTADTPAADRDPAEWDRTLADPIFSLGKGYAPPDLVPVARAGIAGRGRVRGFVIADLRALDRAARSAGVHLRVVSAYRSYATQRTTFAHWVAIGSYRHAVARSARPGHSEHQLGTAIDFGAVGGPDPWIPDDFGATRAGGWLAGNAWKYGFVLSYPAGRQAEVCYDAEAWHFRYLGRAAAREQTLSGLSLRVWLWRLGTTAGSAAGPVSGPG